MELMVNASVESDDEHADNRSVEESDSSHAEYIMNPPWDLESRAGRPDPSLQFSSEEGMLARDIPKPTPYYDPVAERQMSQTDAKLFYQRSQVHDLVQSPQMSPTIAALGSGNTSSMPLSTQHKLPIETSAASETSHNGHASGPILGEIPSFSPSLRANPIPLESDSHVVKEFTTICENIHKLVNLRRKYIRLSGQCNIDDPKNQPSWIVYPPPPDPAWRPDQDSAAQGTKNINSLSNSLSNSMVLASDPTTKLEDEDIGFAASRPKSISATSKKRKPGHDIGMDFDMNEVPIPGSDGSRFYLDSMGVYQIFSDAEALHCGKPAVAVPTLKEFYVDLDFISSVAADGPSKSFAFRRLQYLESRFNLYVIQNGYQEVADSKKVPHRDFYNVRKVDTHVHHSACMNQKHLLRFIKSKLKKHPNEKVIFRDGKLLSLTEVFESIKLTAYDLSIDTLDMHVRSTQIPHHTYPFNFVPLCAPGTLI